MNKIATKYKNLYLFIAIVALIGLISGYIFSNYQTNETKTIITDSIDIKENLPTSRNKIIPTLKKDSLIFIFSLTPITGIINVIKIFYEPFTTGIIINIFKNYPLKFNLIYLNIYFIIPLLITLLIIKNSIILTYKITKSIITKDKTAKKNTLIILKKQILLTIISLIYEIIIWLYSGIINSYLITLI